MSDSSLYGLLAEFNSADALVTAVARARSQTRYTQMEAYSPFPIEGLDEALGPRPRSHCALHASGCDRRRPRHLRA